MTSSAGAPIAQKQHHRGSKRIALTGHLPDPLDYVRIDTYAEQMQTQ